MYKHKPLFYEANPGCTGYKARYFFIAGDALYCRNAHTYSNTEAKTGRWGTIRSGKV